ncbi:MAG: hypothetical protein FWC43_05030 [Planctomycetaceae bacterium]|nr:hypothetical protein [Planctomycetaceae bacterium]
MKIAPYSVLKTVGSLLVAVVLLAIITVVLALTTFIEVDYGEPVVRYFVYDSWWFHFLLLLLAINVLGSLLLRPPLKKANWPFWTTHLGILVLLFGCFITAKWNQEANLTILEGKSARFAVASGHHFALTPVDFNAEPSQDWTARLDRERRETIAIPFEGGPFNWKTYSRVVWFDKTPRPYRFTLWALMKLAGSHRAGNVSERIKTGSVSDIQIEVLDYLSNSDKTPAGPLEITAKWNGKKRDAEKTKLQIAPQVGRLPREESMVEIGLGASQTFAQGEQITFRIAESQAETDAFLQSASGKITSGLGVIVLTHRGEKHVVSLDDLLQKQVAARPKKDTLRDQMSELMRKRQAIQKTEPPNTGASEEIDAQIAQLFREINATHKESFYPLQGTNLSLEISQFVPTGAAIQSEQPDQKNASTGAMVHIVLHASGEETDQLLLYAGRPDLNTQAKKFGVYGTYCIDVDYSKGNAPQVFPPFVLEQMTFPRLDLLQDPQGRIFYRYWYKNRFLATGKVATDLATSILPNEDYGVVLSDLKFVPHDLPGYRIVPVPYAKNLRLIPQQRAKLRCTVDGVAEEFWILAQFPQQDLIRTPLDDEQEHWLHGKNGALRFVYARNEVDLGFSLYLKKFTQKMEPGTQIAAQFSSLVDMRPPEETADRMDLIPARKSTEMFFDKKPESPRQVSVIQKDVLIRMNQPGVFTDQFTGRKYRVYQSGRQGPFGPLSPNVEDRWNFHYLYDQEILPGESEPRDSLYKTILSVNDDPGRGLKYLGCALLVFGTVWMIYRGRRK